MSHVVITTADKRTYRCPAINTGPSLIEMLGVPSVTLGKVIPLNDGSIHRSFRFIGPETKHVDLSEYQNLFFASREWLGRIEPV